MTDQASTSFPIKSLFFPSSAARERQEEETQLRTWQTEFFLDQNKAVRITR